MSTVPETDDINIKLQHCRPCIHPLHMHARTPKRISVNNITSILEASREMRIQWSPLVWSTDVRSTRLYGQFLTGPNHRTLILISNPDIRSARLYGQFSLDKTLTLQAGSTVVVITSTFQA